MASAARGGTDEIRRARAVSPRSKTRDNAKETVCRNVKIYGHCRYENKGCAFIHDPMKLQSNADIMKKRFNVDSPSFTPALPNGTSNIIVAGAGEIGLLGINGTMSKSAGLSPKAASAAPFKPKSIINSTSVNQGNNDLGILGKKSYNPNAPDWSMVPSVTEVNDFLPQSQSLASSIKPTMDNSVKSPWMAALNHSSRKGMTSTAMDISRRGIQFGTVSLDQNSLSVATNSNTETGPGEAMEQESWTDTQTPRRVTSFESNIASPLARRYSQRSDFNAEAVPFRPQDNQPQGLNQNSNLPSVARYCGTVVHPVIHQDITTQAARHALKPFSDPSVQGIAAIDFATLRDFGTASLNQMRMSPNSARQNWYDPRVPERRTISLGSNSVEDVHGSSPWTPNSDRSLSGTFNSQRSDFNGPQSSHHRNRFGNHDNYHDSNSHRPSRRSSAYNSSQGDMNNGLQHTLFDPYGTSASPLPSHAQPHPAQINPYAQDHASNGTSSYYQAPQYSQPIQYHLYANFGPYKENLQPFQRAARDFFLPDALREELQRKSAATLQILPNSSLPPHIEYFHSFVPLDTTNQKNAALFGYPSWIYKATSTKDGNTYALRRLEGFRVSHENGIRPILKWKRISNANVVSVVDAFTTRAFGDSSLLVVTDYHPLSKTLAEAHFPAPRFATRSQTSHVTEAILWSYIVQITNALKSIHAVGLAARVIDPTKVIVTSKNRIRLNACGILDIVQLDIARPIYELQREDLIHFGRLVLALGTNNSIPIHNISKAQEQFARSYSAQLKDRTFWLLNQLSSPRMETIETFATSIEGYTFNALDAQQQLNDQLTLELNRELENSRIARLMMKLNFITERPDFSLDREWAETGGRFPIKLFRDYVFHQVDGHGNPVLDMGHVLACLNKLDAGSEEKMTLTSRDDQIVIVVSYKEIKRAIDGAYGDLVRASRR